MDILPEFDDSITDIHAGCTCNAVLNLMMQVIAGNKTAWFLYSLGNGFGENFGERFSEQKVWGRNWPLLFIHA